jgi:hypothetical protein
MSNTPQKATDESAYRLTKEIAERLGLPMPIPDKPSNLLRVRAALNEAGPPQGWSAHDFDAARRAVMGQIDQHLAPTSRWLWFAGLVLLCLLAGGLWLKVATGNSWYMLMSAYACFGLGFLVMFYDARLSRLKNLTLLGYPALMAILSGSLPTLVSYLQELHQFEGILKFAASAGIAFMALAMIRITASSGDQP